MKWMNEHEQIRNSNSVGKGEWMIVFIIFLEYAGNNKLDYKDLKADDTKNDFVSMVSDLLNKQIPLDFNPPNLK